MQPNANTHSIGALAYRTVDKDVQEDARQITLAGGQRAGLAIISKSNFREDLRSALEHKSALRFMVNVTEKPQGQVILATRCQKAESPDDNCGSEIDITEQIITLLYMVGRK